MTDLDKNIIISNLDCTINQILEKLNFKISRKQVKNFLYYNGLKCKKETPETRKKGVHLYRSRGNRPRLTITFLRKKLLQNITYLVFGLQMDIYQQVVEKGIIFR